MDAISSSSSEQSPSVPQHLQHLQQTALAWKQSALHSDSLEAWQQTAGCYRLLQDWSNWANATQAVAIGRVQQGQKVQALQCHEWIVRKKLEHSDEPYWNGILQTSCESCQTLLAYLGADEEGLQVLGRCLVLLQRQRQRNLPLHQELDEALAELWYWIARTYTECEEWYPARHSLTALVAYNDTGVNLLQQIATQLEYTDPAAALSCMETVLLATSRLHGQEDVMTAQALFRVARVMERTGNVQGSHDLRTAAHRMYVQQLVQTPIKDETNVILQRIPPMFAQEKYQEVVDYVTGCLHAAENMETSTQIGMDKSPLYFELGKAYIGLQDYVSATICLVEVVKEEKEYEDEVVELLNHVDFLQHQPARPAPTSIAPSTPPTSYIEKKSATPVTWEESADSPRILSSSPEDSDIYNTDGNEWTPESELSDQQMFPELIDRVPVFDEDDERVLETSRLLGVHDSSSSPDESRRNNRSRRAKKAIIPEQRPASPRKIFVEKFRRRKKTGFSTLVDDDVPNDDDYHSQVTFEGPIQYVDIRSESWESAVSQITMRMDDPGSPGVKQEWWWGVNSTGFARWFPSTYVSQAVEAAEGFLSAKTIHDKKKKRVAEALPFLADDDDEEDVNMSKTSKTRESGSQNPSRKLSESSQGPTRGNESVRGGASNAPRKGSVDGGASPPPTPPPEQESKKIKADIEACRHRLKKARHEKGPQDPEVSTALFTLAVLHSRDQNVVTAIECSSEALRIQKETHNFVDAVRSLHFLADLHYHQKDYRLAVTFYTEALRIESELHGYTSEDVAKSLNCIGSAKSMQNEFSLAMESHQEALCILQSLHGEEDIKHPLISDTLCQIGAVYYRERNSLTAVKSPDDGYSTFIESGMLEMIGRAHEERGSYKMAISFFEEKLQFLENQAEAEDDLEDAATTLNSLGMLCTRAGLYSEAIEYYEKALSLQLQLGCDEVDLATARVLTGSVHCHLGQWFEARKLLEDALRVLVQELGEDHQTVAATEYQLGVVYAHLLLEHDAVRILNDALETQCELLGEDHPAFLRTRRELCKIQGPQDDEAALGSLSKILQTQYDVHGHKHPNIADTLHTIGCLQIQRREYSEALSALEESYYMRMEFLGWDHPLQASTLHEIAKIHKIRNRTKKACQICDVVIRIRTEVFSDKHMDVARTLTTKASCLLARGDMDGALTSYTAAKVMAEKMSFAPALAEIRMELSHLYLRKCEFDEARAEVEKAMASLRDYGLDDEHIKIIEAQEQLERIKRDELLCV